MTLQLVDGSAAAASSYAFATVLFLLVIVERIVHAAGLLLLRLAPLVLRRRPQRELLCMLVQHLKDKLNSSPANSTSSSVSFNHALDRWIDVFLVANPIYHYDWHAFAPLLLGKSSKAVCHDKSSSSSSEHLLR
jgi:hypothetical protein